MDSVQEELDEQIYMHTKQINGHAEALKATMTHLKEHLERHRREERTFLAWANEASFVMAVVALVVALVALGRSGV